MVNLITAHTQPLELLSILLKNRGITDFQSFLKPPLPVLTLNYEPVVKLIQENYGKNILIYGDYDVDGICATAILYQAISSHSKTVSSFIPHRQLDGYGFKAKSFIRYQQKIGINIDLLITVDNGIVAEPEFKKIKKLFPNLKIIVTDHHLPDKPLKSVDAILHTTETSGAGVSYLLASQLTAHPDLGLAALGVTTDCLPLVGLNRSIVVHGLAELKLNPSRGIKKLIEVSNINRDNLSSYDLGFAIGPRINAVGRLDDPSSALKLLLSNDPQEISELAQSLNDFNKNRQDLQKESLDIADQKVNKNNKLIFITGDFNPGIIGLIAGRLTEKYNLPSIVITTSLPEAKGSCRSIKQLNIIESLRNFSNLFIDLGGHPLAAGFSINQSNIPTLQTKILKLANQELADKDLTIEHNIDAEMELGAVKPINVKAIAKLEPFGIGNQKPLFKFNHLTITSKKVIGSIGDHLKLKFGNIDAIAFKKGELDKTLKVGDSVDIIASLDLNIWNGYTTPQLIVKEIISQ